MLPPPSFCMKGKTGQRGGPHQANGTDLGKNPRFARPPGLRAAYRRPFGVAAATTPLFSAVTVILIRSFSISFFIAFGSLETRWLWLAGLRSRYLSSHLFRGVEHEGLFGQIPRQREISLSREIVLGSFEGDRVADAEFVSQDGELDRRVSPLNRAPVTSLGTCFKTSTAERPSVAPSASARPSGTRLAPR